MGPRVFRVSSSFLFTLTVCGFATQLRHKKKTTAIMAGQATVAIPLTFDGTSSATTQTLTVTVPGYASDTCTVGATITTSASNTTTTTPLPSCVASVVTTASAVLATLTDARKTTVQPALTKATLPDGRTCRRASIAETGWNVVR